MQSHFADLKTSIQMHPLLNKIVLDTIGEFDFLALLALTRTSKTFCHFIRDYVVGLSNLCRFLQQNQYAFHHDGEGVLFSGTEISLLHWAFKAVKDIHGDALYDNAVGFLGPFISATLATESTERCVWTIWKPEHRDIRLLGSRTAYTNYRHNRGVRIVVTDKVERIGDWVEESIESGWMHASPRNQYARDADLAYGRLSAWPQLSDRFSPQIMVNYDFLFCKRLHDDSLRQLNFRKWKKRKSVTQIIHKIYTLLRKDGNNTEILKRNLQCFIKRRLSRKVQEFFTVDDFYTLFEQPWWMDLWTPADLGWWCSVLLRDYERIVSRLFEQCFTSRCDALLWFFLGGYCWKRPSNHCGIVLDQGFIGDMVKSLSTEKRVLLMQEIVELAPEFGVSSGLGEMLFGHFVLRDTNEAELMLATLFKATSKSRMWPLFYDSIKKVAKCYKMDQKFQCLVTGANAQQSRTLNFPVA